MKFIAVQNGARRGYAVPAILERAGMLERFYTDMCGSVGVGRAATVLRHLPVAGKSFAKLHGRKLPAEIVGKSFAFGGPLMLQAIRSLVSRGDPVETLANHCRRADSMGRAMVRAGFGQATHVFSMFGEGGPYLKEAKRRGLSVISEVYLILSALRMVWEERRAFPNWEPTEPLANIELVETWARAGLLANSDLFICPSEAVRDDLIDNWHVAAARTTVVPYGMDPRWLNLEPQPIAGRVLFVGTAELRKGIHYLAMAAERLKAAGRHYEFRVAGQVSPETARQAACRNLTFLGRVPRQKIHEEFQRADVFALPSLAEGSAEVTYEAMAAGVPLVTTGATGSVARDGVEGRIVPERDAAALAEAIDEVVSDRALRERMAIAARERAADYTLDRYGERLVAALRSFQSPAGGA